jgi:acyl transferase domain-containing protein/acyl carrier protein
MNQENLNELSGSIAIIGLAGHFPKSKDLDAFWQNLISGNELSTVFTREKMLESGIDEVMVDNPKYVPVRAILEEADQFDAPFFGYSPREAEVIDPQQRCFLECVWEVLENAGYDPDCYTGAIGLYAGLSMNSYILNNVMASPEVLESTGFYQVMVSNDKDFLTTRASYKLNLKGPSINIQTACSTSLVAVQLACQSLLGYQCDIALAGGVSVNSPRDSGYLYQPGMIMSPDGHCRAFDHRAQGIFGGEGVGVVALKRYSEAVRDGDTIHAIIRGAAINNDGGLKVGYTAPSVDGQAEAILMAQTVSGVDPASITYIETHGTGTEMGDPIEISALTQAFRTGTQEKIFCAIGSVKTNMGHLDAAAGVAGLIKTVLSLENKMLPPSLNFEKPNPHIDFENSPFYVNATLQKWDTDRLPRRAGVSAFGIGGTNAHVILEEAQPVLETLSLHPEQLFLLSARTESALKQATKNLADWIQNHPEANLADAAFTSQIGRKIFKHRRFLVSKSMDESLAILQDNELRQAPSAQQEAKDASIIFLFPGQGAQYVNMGHDLYISEPYFRQQVDHCSEILKLHLGLDLRDILYPSPENTKHAEELIHQTWITQPALFTIEYSLAKLWISWGIQPQAMVGHSIGEYIAACLSGVFTLEDGLALVASRGKLMQGLPGGGMLSVPLTETEVLPLLSNDLSLAVINAPKMCVVAGPHAAVERLEAALTLRGVACRKLLTSHAFHSIMMEPILAEFTEVAKSVSLKEPKIPYLSNVTGGWITAEQATDPAYWSSHIRSTVRYAQNIEVFFKDAPILLEVGPGQTLISLARQNSKKPTSQAALSTLRHPQEQIADTAFITAVLGRLWLAGAKPDWQAYHADEILHRVPLPTYPFEHKRYWIEPKNRPAQFEPEQGTLRKRKDLSSWFYTPTWQRSTWSQISCDESTKETWLIFMDTLGLGNTLIKRLEALGQTVFSVSIADTFTRTGEQNFTVKPDCKEHYTSLLKSISAQGAVPTRIIHMWTLSGEPDQSYAELEEMQQKGFYSLLALAQEFGDSGVKNPLEILVISNQLHEVVGGEPICAAKSTLLGPCKVISQEYPQIKCRSVDIVVSQSATKQDDLLVGQILAEFNIKDTQPVIAYRGAHRWIQTYASNPFPQDSHVQFNLRQGGVYLITGGYGGIGLSLANFLAKTAKANLALVGRSGLPERSDWQTWIVKHSDQDHTSQKIRSIQEMERNGASVLVLQADVANLTQMQSALNRVKTEFGSINGVIHAAGIPGGGLIALKSTEQAGSVLASKVKGTWILDNLLEGTSLDFLMLCSSINSVIGGVGQADYSAANAFLDAFAMMKSLDNPRIKTISVNWSAWQEVGMAVETVVPAHLQIFKEENLRNGISPAEGIAIFTRILASNASQIVVSPMELFTLINKSLNGDGAFRNGADKILPDQIGSTVSQQDLSARPEIQSTFAPPVTEIEKMMAVIWQNMLGVVPIGINDNFFELGGHSLMATQILSRVRDLYKIDLPLRTFFETNTIAELAKRIEAIQWIERNQEVTGSESTDREEVEL